jgi:hypothetical protein
LSLIYKFLFCKKKVPLYLKIIPRYVFSVFLNDLEYYFKTLDGIPLEKLKERFYNELHILFELFVILYAPDTVLLSETKEGMQQSLNI